MEALASLLLTSSIRPEWLGLAQGVATGLFAATRRKRDFRPRGLSGKRESGHSHGAEPEVRHVLAWLRCPH